MASPASNWKKDFSLQKYLNRFDLHIAETSKKNFLIRKEIILPLQSATKCSKKLLNLLSEQGPKYDSLSSTRWWHSMEWWNGSIKQKSHNYNEIRKWFIIIETQGYTDREQWGYWVSPYKLSLLWLLLSSSLLSLLLVWSFVTI